MHSVVTHGIFGPNRDRGTLSNQAAKADGWVGEEAVERGIAQQESLRTPGAMRARILADAVSAFGDKTEPEFLEACVDTVVEQLWTDTPRVTNFIPLLALRRIRDIVGDEAAGMATS